MDIGDFELDGYLMGTAHEVVVEDWDLGTDDWTTQDSDSPVTGFRLFGRDTLTGPTWTLTLSTNTDTPADARAALNRAKAAWRPAGASVPGALSVLRYNIDGEVRRVYGRPRKFAPVVGGMLASATAGAVGEFTTADALTYADTVEVAAVNMIPASTGGFTVPFTAPIITASTGETQGTFTNTGEVPAPFALSIHGPVANPTVTGDGWSLRLLGTLAYDETVTIDTRSNTVISDIRGSVPGLLAVGSRLYTARLKPGPGYITYSGADLSGTSYATLAWRPAYVGL